VQKGEHTVRHYENMKKQQLKSSREQNQKLQNVRENKNDLIDSINQIDELFVEEEIGLVEFDLDYLLLLLNDHSYLSLVQNQF